MSELINKHNNRTTIRWNLLTGASVLALTAYVSSVGVAEAETSNGPQIWIELGGQLSLLENGEQTLAPPIMNARPSIFERSQPFEHPPRSSLDEVGKISLQPDNSNWVFSASVSYGRSSSKKQAHQQTSPKTWIGHQNYYGRFYTFSAVPGAARFTDTNVQSSEQHLVLDFQAGKDVGLGIFGSENGTSVLGLGIRFAQFNSKSNIALKSDPDRHFQYKYNPALLNFGFTTSKRPLGSSYHTNLADLQSVRNFHGIGPSLSWSASAPFVGNPQEGQISVDWGVNVAILFGRQTARIHHQTTGRYHGISFAPASHPVTYQAPAMPDRTRSRRVTVPNVGGTVGLTYSYSRAKVSVGYRADFFFGAMDGGIDSRESENRGFYGPFATVSIGLGG